MRRRRNGDGGDVARWDLHVRARERKKASGGFVVSITRPGRCHPRERDREQTRAHQDPIRLDPTTRPDRQTMVHRTDPFPTIEPIQVPINMRTEHDRRLFLPTRATILDTSFQPRRPNSIVGQRVTSRDVYSPWEPFCSCSIQ